MSLYYSILITSIRGANQVEQVELDDFKLELDFLGVQSSA